MAIYFTRGTLSYKSEITKGKSQAGREWARQTIMLDVPGYKGSIFKISFNVDINGIEAVKAFNLGDKVEIGWSIYAREYNGKWYNNVDLVKIQSVPEVTGDAEEDEDPDIEEVEESGDDFPF